MQVAVLGLSKMGLAIMNKLLLEGHEVIAWNHAKDVYEQLKMSHSDSLLNQKLALAFSIEGMREKLQRPRVFWLMRPAGQDTEDVISEIVNIAETGDIIIDGGNSYYKDTQKRYDILTPKGFKFMGIGVAGDIRGLDEGFCMMVGGNSDGYEFIKPMLDSLAKPNGGYSYFGQGGAGHFVKSVHNGIEYGMMQSLAEGFGVLEKSQYSLSLPDVAYVWQRGSTLRSFLLDLVANIFVNEPDFIKETGYIETSGDGKWTVESAKEEHVPSDIIAKALEFRQHSQYDSATQATMAAKLVTALRKKFGGHEETTEVKES